MFINWLAYNFYSKSAQHTFMGFTPGVNYIKLFKGTFTQYFFVRQIILRLKENNRFGHFNNWIGCNRTRKYQTRLKVLDKDQHSTICRNKKVCSIDPQDQSYKTFFYKINIIYDRIGRMHLQPNLMFVVRARAYQSGVSYELREKASALKKTSAQRPVL